MTIPSEARSSHALYTETGPNHTSNVSYNGRRGIAAKGVGRRTMNNRTAQRPPSLCRATHKNSHGDTHRKSLGMESRNIKLNRWEWGQEASNWPENTGRQSRVHQAGKARR